MTQCGMRGFGLGRGEGGEGGGKGRRRGLLGLLLITCIFQF